MFGEKKIIFLNIMLFYILLCIFDIIHVIFYIINFYYNYSLHTFEHLFNIIVGCNIDNINF